MSVSFSFFSQSLSHPPSFPLSHTHPVSCSHTHTHFSPIATKAHLYWSLSSASHTQSLTRSNRKAHEHTPARPIDRSTSLIFSLTHILTHWPTQFTQAYAQTLLLLQSMESTSLVVTHKHIHTLSLSLSHAQLEHLLFISLNSTSLSVLQQEASHSLEPQYKIAPSARQKASTRSHTHLHTTSPSHSVSLKHTCS